MQQEHLNLVWDHAKPTRQKCEPCNDETLFVARKCVVCGWVRPAPVRHVKKSHGFWSRLKKQTAFDKRAAKKRSLLELKERMGV